MTESTEPTWALVEIMGHRRRAGLCQEVDLFGSKQLRIDIPAGDGFVTEFYGGSAIFAFRPATEEVARALADQIGDPRPVNPVAYRLPAPDAERGDDGPDYASGFDDEDDDEVGRD